MKLGPALNRSPNLLACIGLTAGVAVAACSTKPTEGAESTESAVSGVPIGEVRGIVDISNTVRGRLLDDTDPLTATFDVSRVAGPVFRLRRQLGVFAAEGTTSTYQGGTPTPLRITLWHQAFGRFATAMGDVCTTPGTAVTFAVYAQGPEGITSAPATFHLDATVAERVANACVFGVDENARRQTASALWDAVMGLGSTLSADKAAFETEFSAEGSATVSAPPNERVTNMILAMLLNPHFLLAK